MIKLLRLSFDHLCMFEDGILSLDFYAQDKVFSDDESATCLYKPVYSSNVVALAGINASGKSIALSLIDLALRVLGGEPIGLKGYDRGLANAFDGRPTLKALVWNDGGIQLLCSEILVRGDFLDDASSAGELVFGKETVFDVPASDKPKTFLAKPFDEIAAASRTVMTRSGLGASESRFLKDDVSIYSACADVGPAHLYLEAADFPLSLSSGFSGLDAVLRAFDASIEHLEVSDSGRAFRLKLFTREEPLTLSREGLEDILSSGTVKGLMVTQRAVIMLRRGGYLILDEIENHLNRQLVNVIIDLFCSRETNPNGATLVFSTHYPEVLDHLRRKDDVYFLARSRDFKSTAIKYSSRVKRVENKKSEVFASNYIGGTAPSYSGVKALRDWARSEAKGETHA